MPRRNADAGIFAPGSAVNNGIEQLVLRLQRVGPMVNLSPGPRPFPPQQGTDRQEGTGGSTQTNLTARGRPFFYFTENLRCGIVELFPTSGDK
jgi:hypothetical protein